MKHEHAAAAAFGPARRAVHRVAVIGHGPAAIETSDLLICMGDHFVDLFSPTPAPTCLIRFGSTRRAGDTTESDNLVPRLRLFGNVQVGSDAGAVTVGELTRYYDTVIVASDTAAGNAGAEAGLVVVGNSREAAATYEFLRAHTALPLSRTPVVTEPAAASNRPGAVVALLESRRIPFTTWAGWHRPAWAGASTNSNAPRSSRAVQSAGPGSAFGSVVTAADWFSLIAIARAVPDTP